LFEVAERLADLYVHVGEGLLALRFFLAAGKSKEAVAVAKQLPPEHVAVVVKSRGVV
jgi:hypothetical protein